MTNPVASYALDDGTSVQFEVIPTADWRPVSSQQVLGQIQAAVRPALDAAKAVLEQAKEAAPDEVELTFGIKVSGTANWVVARAATEANFEVKLTWKRNGVSD